MASKRYKSTLQFNDELGNRHFGITMYPKIPKVSSDIYIVARKGDRLDILAHKYYEDSTLWWIIAQANHLGKGSISVSVPQRLRIPTNIDAILKNLERFQGTR